jgi:hypothetical protein
MLLLTLTTAASLLAATPAFSAVPCHSSHAHVTERYIESARQFATTGAIEDARREYRIATMLGFDGGCLPEATAKEYATLLLSDAREREASAVMRELATAAAQRGEHDVEARALVASAWLLMQAGDRTEAKQDVRRLHVIAKEGRVSADTRALLRKALRT